MYIKYAHKQKFTNFWNSVSISMQHFDTFTIQFPELWIQPCIQRDIIGINFEKKTEERCA